MDGRTHRIAVRVRYSETDKMGYVYHGNYAQYLEMGRVEWMRQIDVPYREMEQSGIMLPVLHLSIDFKKAAVYDEVIAIETTLSEGLPAYKLEFTYQIFGEAGDLLCTAFTALVFISAETRKPIRCPDYLLEKLRRLDAPK